MKSDFVMGVGLGVGLGLLFARQSGDKTRADIRQMVKESLDESAAAATKLGRPLPRPPARTRSGR